MADSGRMKQLSNLERRPALTDTPQALAWGGSMLWLSSRDLGTLYEVDADKWKISAEIDPPGIVWAGVLTNDGWRFTIGKGLNDDRYIYRYREGEGFTKLFACPEMAGSYLSFDGQHLYLSRWYKGQIHQLNDAGETVRLIDIGEEICGQTFADGTLYVLRGRENADVPNAAEEWRIARVDVRQETPTVEDLATVPFASRSLTFDGRKFWSNHRAANETVSFTL
jgi:hypothetical protein